ncbi:MAG: ABC transporter ATP-binding protein [Clostridia bacterium]|nr:ABC transporter ATP-binding protein [Clostridia bacterium]
MIELRDVVKTYGKGDAAVHALKTVNMKIEDGKFTAIIGKSGSGKSTLMNIIGGLDSPTEGKVYSEGLDLTSLSNNELADYRNRTTGFIFQSFYLEPTFTVLENVAMPLTIRGIPKREREAAARKIIGKLGLTDKVNKKANELSGGQKQRVSIARALVHDPSIVLADEPTGNLDSANGAEVIKILRQICTEGKSVVLVTHNIDDAKQADVVFVIKDGLLDKELRRK